MTLSARSVTLEHYKVSARNLAVSRGKRVVTENGFPRVRADRSTGQRPSFVVRFVGFLLARLAFALKDTADDQCGLIAIALARVIAVILFLGTNERSRKQIANPDILFSPCDVCMNRPNRIVVPRARDNCLVRRSISTLRNGDTG